MFPNKKILIIKLKICFCFNFASAIFNFTPPTHPPPTAEIPTGIALFGASDHRFFFHGDEDGGKTPPRSLQGRNREKIICPHKFAEAVHYT
jgi:hypothetical protein